MIPPVYHPKICQSPCGSLEQGHAEVVPTAHHAVQVYTTCRTFIAKLQAYAPDAPVNTRKLVLRWVIALPYVMRTHLVDYKPGSDSLEELLPKEEVRSHACHEDVHLSWPACALECALLPRGLLDVSVCKLLHNRF